MKGLIIGTTQVQGISKVQTLPMIVQRLSHSFRGLDDDIFIAPKLCLGVYAREALLPVVSRSVTKISLSSLAS